MANAKANLKADMVRAALSVLLNTGADVRTIRAYPIRHAKVVIAYRKTAELGSFNFSEAVARKNSENVFVNWGNPKLAEAPQKFDRNYAQATPYIQGY